ncbi:MAG TPA: thioredoxin family protein [Pirellulaceae bacterium]
MSWSWSRSSKVFAMSLIGFAASLAWAGKYNEVLDLGSEAPGWENLAGGDGKSHSLSDLQESQLVVVVFTCNSCPVAQAYEQRLIEFAKDYRDRGAALVAIHVHRDESLADATEHARDKGFNFPYVHDAAQEIARAYGATTTPHVFVLDKDRKVAYMGAVDDNMNAAEVEHHYLREAVDALLKEEVPASPETRQFGCGIKWQ